MNSLANRFWAKVERRDGDCWRWLAARNKLGYGIVAIKRRSRLAHRIAFELVKGPIPDGMILRHTCDNPCCVNPDHLIPGTDRDNMADQIERGRRADCRGEKNGRSKLSAADVAEIRRIYAGGSTILEIAPQFGVSKSQVWNIVAGHQWNEMPELRA